MNAKPCQMVSVILPVYNEEGCIEATLREVFGVLARLDCKAEVMAVDDGSTDGTAGIFKRLQGEYSSLRVLTLHPHSGQSAAFGAAFRRARGDVIVTMDADGQNDPADIPRLLSELDRCDCCCGFRRHRRDTFSRRIGSRLANGIRNRVLREDIIDTGCSLKAFKAGLVRDLAVWKGMHRFFPALFRMQGARIRQIPVNHRARTAGRSKYTNLRRLKETVWDLWAVRWMQRRHMPCDVEEN